MSLQTSPVAPRGKPEPTPFVKALLGLPGDVLYKMAFRRTRHAASAEDLAQQATLVALRRDRAGKGWKAPPPPVERYLSGIMFGEVANKRRTDRYRITEVEGETEQAPSDKPHAEHALVQDEEEREERELKAKLRAHFEGKPNGHIPVGVIDAAEDGASGYQEIADRIGCSREDVYAAKRRVLEQWEVLAKPRPTGGGPS